MDAEENGKYKNCNLYINYSKCYSFYKKCYENLNVKEEKYGINVINVLSHVPYFKKNDFIQQLLFSTSPCSAMLESFT